MGWAAQAQHGLKEPAVSDRVSGTIITPGVLIGIIVARKNLFGP